MRALRAVAEATLSRFARLEPPAEVLILINDRRKTCFKAGFSNGGRERITRILDARLRAVAEATLSSLREARTPAEVLILINDRRKTCFKSRFFEWWSAREDSNLRPTGPKPVALPSCATRRCGAHLLLAVIGVNHFLPLHFVVIKRHNALRRGCAAYFTQALAVFSAGVCARRNGSRNSADRQAAMEITTKKPFQCQISITRAIG